MQRRALLGGYLAIALCLLAGCATAPVQEMSDARQAISAAVDAGADELAPVEIGAARRYLDQAEEQLKTRSFNSARSDALRAKEKAIEALEVVNASGEPEG